MSFPWLKGWTKPVYRKRWHNLRGYVSPFTGRVGGSVKLGPLTFTGTGRIYIFGARIR